MIYTFRNFKNVAYFAFGRGTFDRLDEILDGDLDPVVQALKLAYRGEQTGSEG